MKVTGIILAIAAALVLGGCGSQPTTVSQQVSTTNDTAYLLSLDQESIRYSSSNQAIAVGKSVCQDLDSGASVVTVGLSIVANSTYTPDQAGFIVGSSIAAYCSQHLSELPTS